ncbi:unnamed protein product [Zymoseptoria tritici ST99CH_1E4]|uniref:Uncharacterized protein n=1 Tax=Zymoseptoria tritici ST99CH_1E4 TaxID=1276532 RepID=A0A2H1H9I9_ZYMTR|nr:unnamed protein product [Zymoseptoria tritici ST99CH_1E4]
MLMWRRIVEMLNPGKSAQVLEIMKKRLFARIGGVAPTEIGVSKDDIYNNIALWSVLGDKIKTFCTALGGNGCLFFLSSQLSVAFLRSKFTSSKRDREITMRHLKKIGLPRRVRNPIYAPPSDGIESLVLLANDSTYHIAGTTDVRSIVGIWSKSYALSGPEPEYRLNQLRYI